MISRKLDDDMKVAMKAGDKNRLSVIRMLRSELKNARINQGEELSEEQEQKVLSSYAKKRQESIHHYTEGGRQDLADKEKFEYDVTLSYLPPRLDENELASIVSSKIEETGAEGPADFGRVMKAVMETVAGRADGSMVSGMVKKILNK